MKNTTPPVPLTLTSRVDQVFPMLTPEQIARLAVHGQVRPSSVVRCSWRPGNRPHGFSSSPRGTS